MPSSVVLEIYLKQQTFQLTPVKQNTNNQEEWRNYGKRTHGGH